MQLVATMYLTGEGSTQANTQKGKDMNTKLQARYAAAKAKAKQDAEATEAAHAARFKEMRDKLDQMMQETK